MRLFFFLSWSVLQQVAFATVVYDQSRTTGHVANETNTYDYVVTGSGPGGGKLSLTARTGEQALTELHRHHCGKPRPRRLFRALDRSWWR